VEAWAPPPLIGKLILNVLVKFHLLALFMIQQEKFFKVIGEIKALYVPKKTIQDYKHQWEKFIPELQQLYKKEIEILEKAVNTYIDKGAYNIEVSSFEVMDYNFRENTHSNVLKYLFDYNNVGNTAINLLSELISGAAMQEDDSLMLLEKIKRKNYTITREFSTKKGRIDLLIVDDKQKFVIVIENKLLAGIGKARAYNFDEEETKTQLDHYYDFISEKYINYKKCYILLQLNGVELENNIFRQVKLKELFNAMNREKDNCANNIFKEYFILLRAIFEPEHDACLVKEKVNKLKSKTGISLNDLYFLKTIYEK
jgi:hypothetical protein